MNLLNSSRSYDDLIRDMKLMGYSECYIKHVQREICWIAKYQMEKNQTYEHTFHMHSAKLS